MALGEDGGSLLGNGRYGLDGLYGWLDGFGGLVSARVMGGLDAVEEV